MNAMTAGRTPTERRSKTLVVTAVVGVIAGAAVSLIAFYVARYGPPVEAGLFVATAPSLHIPLAAYSLVPVALTAGWCALVLRVRGSRAWLAMGLVQG